MTGVGSRELWLGDLRHHWIEYVAVVAIIAAASAAIVFQDAVADLAEEGVHELAHRLGKNMLVVPSGADPLDAQALEIGPETMPEDYPQRVASSPLGPHLRLVHARLNGNVIVQGVPLVLVGEGTAPRTGTPAPVRLGPEAAAALGARPGQNLMLGEVPVTVAGVLNPPPDGIGMGVFAPLATAQAVLERPGAINTMRLGGCWCRFDVPELGRQVEQLLPGTKAITVAGVLEAQKGTVATMKRYSLLLYLVSCFLVAATVLALTWSQVRRSLRELGVLLAVGASPASVQAQVLLRAAVLGLIGGAAGFLAGAVWTERFGASFVEVALEPDPRLLLPIVLLCGGVSVLGALAPARWAAAVDPCKVLREE